ncbi:MAG TPA: hypothetical protein VIF12_02500 [Micavibrio sp.]|jgi:hypothetical protein
MTQISANERQTLSGPTRREMADLFREASRDKREEAINLSRQSLVYRYKGYEHTDSAKGKYDPLPEGTKHDDYRQTAKKCFDDAADLYAQAETARKKSRSYGGMALKNTILSVVEKIGLRL